MMGDYTLDEWLDNHKPAMWLAALFTSATAAYLLANPGCVMYKGPIDPNPIVTRQCEQREKRRLYQKVDALWQKEQREAELPALEKKATEDWLANGGVSVCQAPATCVKSLDDLAAKKILVLGDVIDVELVNKGSRIKLGKVKEVSDGCECIADIILDAKDKPIFYQPGQRIALHTPDWQVLLLRDKEQYARYDLRTGEKVSFWPDKPAVFPSYNDHYVLTMSPNGNYIVYGEYRMGEILFGRLNGEISPFRTAHGTNLSMMDVRKRKSVNFYTCAIVNFAVDDSGCITGEDFLHSKRRIVYDGKSLMDAGR
jgi:hypothetical protein